MIELYIKIKLLIILEFVHIAFFMQCKTQVEKHKMPQHQASFAVLYIYSIPSSCLICKAAS